jgi:8-oxo-dGTP pyrophosphatase MutT (NUDIX family)
MVGSSILPIAKHKGKLYFLFGKENDLEDSAKGWSDFGGGIERGEKPLDTALREGAEELTGFLGDSKDLEKCFKQRGHLLLGDPYKYNIHVLEIEYDPNLPKYYNNNHGFLWKRMNKHTLSKTKLFEKIEVGWFSIQDIRRRLKEFRSFYQDILLTHVLSNLPKINKYLSLHRKTTGRNTKRSYGRTISRKHRKN